MLKKRILASSMASVMALTSVCAVAFADEAFDPDAQQSVTKEQLATYLASDDIKSKIDSSAEEYGTVSGKNFLRACAFAKKVIDGEYDTYSDVFATVAFQMVRAERAQLVQYTNVQLNDLVKSYKKIYETANRLNGNTNDLIYSEGTWTAFADKYEEALTMENATDIRVTTDVYEELEAAYKSLYMLPTKTKSQLETAKKNYDLAIKGEYKWQPWARGTVKDTNTGFDNKEYSWGALFSHVRSGEGHVTEMYDLFNNNAYKGVTITSNPEIVQAVNDMETGAKVLNSFVSNFEAGSTNTKAGTILRRYHGQLVYTYNKREEANSGSGATVGNITYKDQAYEMLDELAESLKKTTKGDTVQAFTKSTRTAEASWIYYNAVPAYNSADENSYKYGYWNISSADLSYGPLGNSSHKEADKILSAELKARIDSKANKTVFAIETVDKNVSGEGTYVRTTAAERADNTDGGAAAGYFFVVNGVGNAQTLAAKAAAEAAIKNLPNPTKYKAVPVNASATIVLSDHVDVNSTDILDIEAGGSAGKDYRDAAVDNEKAEYELKLALADLEEAVKADNTANSLTNKVKKATGTGASITAGEVVNASDATQTRPLYRYKDVNGTKYLLHKDGTGYLKETDGTAITFAAAAADATLLDDAVTFGTAANANWSSNATDLLAEYNTKYSNVYKAAASGGTKAVLATNYDAYVLACGTQSYTKTHAEANNVIDGVYDTGTWAGDSTDGYPCATAHYSNFGLSDNFVWNDFGGTADSDKGIEAHDAITYKRVGDGNLVPIAPSIVYATLLYDEYTGLYDLDKKTRVEATALARGTTNEIGPDALSSDNSVNMFIRVIDGITDVTTIKGNSTPEWKLICNYMQYAMSDKFDGETGTLKTRRDVQELLNKSYNLVENTVDTSLFTFSNMKLVDERVYANDWDKDADLLRKDYKDNVSTPKYNINGTDVTPTLADSAYKYLDAKYSQLNNEYEAFKYSFKDIADQISRLSKQVDANDPNNEALIKAIADVADKMVKVEGVKTTNPQGQDAELVDSQALTEDGDFKYNNRCYTTDGTTKLQTEEESSISTGYSWVKSSKGGENQTHYDLKVAYNNMLELVKRKKGDVNNDGKINAADAVLVLQDAADIKKLDDSQKSYADMNGDGKINAADAAEILKLAAK